MSNANSKRKYVQELLEKAGITRKELGERAGISYPYVAQMISGRTNLTNDAYTKIVDVLTSLTPAIADKEVVKAAARTYRVTPLSVGDEPWELIAEVATSSLSTTTKRQLIQQLNG